MSQLPEGRAIVYCEGAFQTTNGKTAHGLVRKTRRYDVLAVIDSTCAGQDAGLLLDGKEKGIPLVANLAAALEHARSHGGAATHFVNGVAPDGGRITPAMRAAALAAIEHGLHVDCGLHDYLSEDEELAAAAQRRGVSIRDVRKTPPRTEMHGFSGKIEEVTAFKIAVLGTDSAIGKRTTAWVIADGLNAAGHSAEMIGTGQTAWMQGARYGIILDSLINDFVAGELEHAVWSAWNEQRPENVIVEGQGSLMNPAYPGGFEILAATRPDVVVLQHAPTRKEYDGFPGFPLHPLDKQIHAIEYLFDRPVVAVTVNHENLSHEQTPAACEEIQRTTGRPAFDVLRGDAEALVRLLVSQRAKP